MGGGDHAVLHLGERGIARLRRLIGLTLEPCLDRRRWINAIALQDLARVRIGRRVWCARAGRDVRRVVAGDIGDDERQHRRARRGGEAAAVDRGEVLAHGIHLPDGGAAL